MASGVPRTILLARRWFPRRAPALRITAIGACGKKIQSSWRPRPMAEKVFDLQCPVPLNDVEHVQLAHGGGGRRMHELLEGLLLPSFASAALLERHDGATLRIGDARLAFTTDSNVVKPLFFPGGDIGTLAING